MKVRKGFKKPDKRGVRMQSSVTLDDLPLNFQEVKKDLSPKEAVDEANRCLYCYDAPCTKACPTSINIPAFIKKIASENLKGSARVILDANPLGATCARVCPTEELCEGACVLNDISVPVMIGQLQRHATNWAIHHHQPLFKKGNPNGKKVAIIGSGPAGLSGARELARLGYEVTIFEAKEKAGGLNTYGIVPFRLPQEISLWEVEQVKQLGVEILTNTIFGEDIMVNEVMEDYDAVLLAIGMGKVPMLGIPGEELHGVYDAIQLIEEIKDGDITDRFIGKRAAVIGAGNTAIDAATCLKRMGASNVKIVYRRSESEMTAYASEYEFAKQEGVEFRWLTQPTEIIDDGNGNVGKLKCSRTKLGELDHSGRRSVEIIENSDFSMDVDIVVKAIGQTRHKKLIEELGLEHDQGIVKIDPVTHQTSNKKLFAAGDVVVGKGQGDAMVVSAVEQGKKAARAIHRHIQSSL